MKFAIIDADISFFTKPEELRCIYQPVGDDIPISLAVVPFCSGNASCLTDIKGNDLEYPIGENIELVEFLRSGIISGKFDILLHGYNHKESECGTNEDTSWKIQKGKNYIENLLGKRITVFLPPNSKISVENIKVIERFNLALIGQFSFNPFKRERPLSLYNIPFFLRERIFSISNKDVQYPFVINIGKRKELEPFILVKTTKLQTLTRAIDICKKVNGVFCLEVHYWELNKFQYMKQVLVEVIKYARSINRVKFVNISNIFS
jgi:hypothetical protein